MKLSVRRDLAQDRQVRIGRHHDRGLDLACDGVLGQCISRVALGGNGQATQPQGSRHRHGHRHPPILEGKRGIGAETAMMSPFVLDLEIETRRCRPEDERTPATVCIPRPG